jgi:hypothetical protein
MSRFLKLTNRIINIKYITQIHSYDNSFQIMINTNNLSGINIFGFGTISWLNEWIYVRDDSEKESDKKDYQIIKDWVEKLDT